MADELEVKAHLGGMEIRDRWRDLAPRMRAAETALATPVRTLAVGMKEELQSLRTLVQELRDAVIEKIQPKAS